jgi:hypothetical protein
MNLAAIFMSWPQFEWNLARKSNPHATLPTIGGELSADPKEFK